MSEERKNKQMPLDGRQIDLLVDGELDETSRRQLLAGLDDQPGGWRQCALAFLENQSWRQACSSLATKKDAAHTLTSPSRQQNETIQIKRTPGAVARAAGVLLAMAASFLIALGLGSMIWNADQQGHLGIGGGPQQANVLSAAHDATPADPNDRVLVRDARVFLPGQYQTVTISDKQPDGTMRSIQLPAVVQNNIDETRLRETPSAIPPELVQAFQKAGHNVHQSRRLVPFRMKDGRRLVVPVDQLDVRYVGSEMYQ